MTTFLVPLPPPTNSGYKLGTRFVRPKGKRAAGWMARMMKTDKLLWWEQEVEYIKQGWVPPERTPLAVDIVLRVAKADMRRKDIDGMHKFLLDSLVGKRRDQWVDRLTVAKVEGDDTAVVTVEAITTQKEGEA